MNLTYQAVDSSGAPVKAVIDAKSAREAIETLRRRGLFVKTIEPAKQAARSRLKKTHGTGGPALPLKTLLFVTRQMTMLLKSGSAVVPALHVVRKQMKRPEHARLIEALIADLEDGTGLADAMAKFPRVFNAAFRAIIAAGEASATLPDMFDRLANILMKRRALRNKIVGAMVYPTLLMAMCVNVVTGMLFFVVPRFAGMFTTLNVDIPWTTQLLLDISHWLSSYWYVPLSAAIVGAGLLGFAAFSAPGRQFISNVQTKVPVIGRLMSRLIQAQMYRTLGTLIECRVALLDALSLTRGVTSNRTFQNLFEEVTTAVTSGNSLSGVLLGAPFIDPAFAYAIATGEESGNLGSAITYCADILEEENTELIAAMTKLIEPMILIVMGVVVGGVAISLFMPLFDLTSAMG